MHQGIARDHPQVLLLLAFLILPEHQSEVALVVGRRQLRLLNYLRIRLFLRGGSRGDRFRCLCAQLDLGMLRALSLLRIHVLALDGRTVFQLDRDADLILACTDGLLNEFAGEDLVCLDRLDGGTAFRDFG